MNISANISNNIKKYRKEQSMSQEALAEKLGVTSQAVSKWECMQSIPDIDAMVEMCDLMGISLDKLVLDKDAEVIYKEVIVEKEPEDDTNDSDEGCDDEGAEHTESENGDHFNRKGFFRRMYFDALPDDNELRVLQFKGRLMLSEHTYNRNTVIPLALAPEFAKKKTVNVHIVGNAQIDGDISGNVKAGDHLTCGNVAGNAHAGDSLRCGNVGGNVNAGDSVSCGNVGGSINAGDGVRCGDVNGSVRAGDNVICRDVKVIQRCGGSVHCQSMNHSNGSTRVEKDK